MTRRQTRRRRQIGPRNPLAAARPPKPAKFRTNPPTAGEAAHQQSADAAAAPEPVSSVSARQDRERRKALAIPGDNLALPDKPSIAILPFANFSDEADLAHFTDGLTEDITTELSRFRSLFVISRNSAFTFKHRPVDVRTVARELGVRYVLEGSVQHAKKRARVTAQLVDALSGNHIWAEKYDRVLADIFDVQEEVTRAIVSAIEPQIDHAEGNWARKSRPENLAAYGLALRAWSIANDDMLEPASAQRDVAYALAQEAVNADAAAALAWRTIALIQWTRVYFNAAASRADALAEGLHAANRAISLDTTDYIAMTWKGVLLGLDGQEEAALAALRAAQSINRNYVLGSGFLGLYEALAGNKELSVRYALEAFRLSPRDPYQHHFLVLLSFTYFANRQDAQALEIAEMAMRESPDKPVPYLLLALTHVGLGHLEAAKRSFFQLAIQGTPTGQSPPGRAWADHRRRVHQAGTNVFAGRSGAGEPSGCGCSALSGHWGALFTAAASPGKRQSRSCRQCSVFQPWVSSAHSWHQRGCLAECRKAGARRSWASGRQCREWVQRL